MTADGAGLITAGLSHADVLAALHETGFSDPWPNRAFRDLLGLPTVQGWIASAAEPTGFILIRVAADKAEILTLAVAVNHRQNGIGRRLVEHAMVAIRKTGARLCHLEVAADNAAGQALYATLGFTVAGRWQGYYVRADGGADAVLMTCHVQGRNQVNIDS